MVAAMAAKDMSDTRSVALKANIWCLKAALVNSLPVSVLFLFLVAHHKLPTDWSSLAAIITCLDIIEQQLT